MYRTGGYPIMQYTALSAVALENSTPDFLKIKKKKNQYSKPENLEDDELMGPTGMGTIRGTMHGQITLVIILTDNIAYY